MKRKSLIEFLNDANKKYPLYDYSKIKKYKNNTTKIEIICKKHGSFFTTPNCLLHPKTKCPCPICRSEKSNNRRYKNKYVSNNDFVLTVKTLYPNINFDFQFLNYTKSHNDIVLKCKKHGIFKCKAYYLLLFGENVCKLCANENKDIKKSLEIQHQINIFILLYRNILKNNYNITFNIKLFKNVTDKYWYRHIKFKFRCKKHGIFNTTIESIKYYITNNKSPCIKCRNVYTSRKYTNKEFITLLKKIYYDKNYNYSKTKYINWKTKVEIICPKHGIFKRLPQRLNEGRGCPYCQESLLERDIRLFLMKKNIDFIYLYRNKKILGRKTLDFFIPKYNIGIECQGKQHLSIDSIFNKNLKNDDIYKYDIYKNKLCKKHGIKILYFTNIKTDNYFDKLYYDKNELLKEIIKNDK